VLDHLRLAVVARLDQVRQVVALLQDVRGVLDPRRLLLPHADHRLLGLAALPSDHLLLSRLEVLDEGLDLKVPGLLEFLDLLIALLANDLDLHPGKRTCSFSRTAIFSRLWTNSCPTSCSILFFTLSAPAKS
jgi:hypothetical protein